MTPIEAYRRYAAMIDRSAFPVELGCARCIDDHYIAALGIDLWAVTMTVYAKLGQILEHADCAPDLFLHRAPQAYMAMVNCGCIESSEEDVMAEALALIHSLSIYHDEPLRPHTLN